MEKVTQLPSIVQPTGKTITASIDADGVTLKSEMEIVSVKD